MSTAIHRIIVYLVPCDLGGTCMLQILTQQLVVLFSWTINVGISYVCSLTEITV